MKRIVQIVFNGKNIDSTGGEEEAEEVRTKKNVRDLVRHLFCFFFMFPPEFVLYYFRNTYDTTNTTQTKSVTSFCNTKSWKKEMFLYWVHPQYELCFLSVLQMN